MVHRSQYTLHRCILFLLPAIFLTHYSAFPEPHSFCLLVTSGYLGLLLASGPTWPPSTLLGTLVYHFLSFCLYNQVSDSLYLQTYTPAGENLTCLARLTTFPVKRSGGQHWGAIVVSRSPEHSCPVRVL